LRAGTKAGEAKVFKELHGHFFPSAQISIVTIKGDVIAYSKLVHFLCKLASGQW